MFPRLAVLAFLASIVAAVAACQSSGAYGSPAQAAVATGFAAAGAAASVATGGCAAQCLPGSFCNTATHLCQRRETAPEPVARPAVGVAGKPPLAANASYPPGHEFEVPPASAADAGCDPTTSDGGAISCEMDAAATPH